MRKNNSGLLDGLRVSLTEQIDKYAYKTGERPRVILAECDAFYILSLDRDFIHCVNGLDRWRGIPIKRIAFEGFGVYLCGEPIRFCEVKKCDGPTVWFEGEDDGK